MARRQRLYIDAPLSAGAVVTLGPDRAHRLRAVLRLGPGAPLALFNGADGEWTAELVSLTKNDATAKLDARSVAPSSPPAPPLRLVFAPIKRAPLDWLVEKATELGAAQLTPVWTKRAHVERVNLERLGLIALEATEQCERLAPPVIDAPTDLAHLLADWPSDAPLFVALERAAEAPSLAVAAADGAAARGSGAGMGLMIGPEGGLAEEERRLLQSFPFVHPVHLGPRILRAETAAVAGLTLLQALAGDWR